MVLKITFREKFDCGGVFPDQTYYWVGKAIDYHRKCTKSHTRAYFVYACDTLIIIGYTYYGWGSQSKTAMFLNVNKFKSCV